MVYFIGMRGFEDGLPRCARNDGGLCHCEPKAWQSMLERRRSCPYSAWLMRKDGLPRCARNDGIYLDRNDEICFDRNDRILSSFNPISGV
jgi:hypothetical protein